MTRIYSEGFEFRDVVGLTTTASIYTAVKRSGAACLELSKGDYLSYSVANLTEAYIRFGLYKRDGSGTQGFYLMWRNGTTVLGRIYINYATDG